MNQGTILIVEDEDAIRDMLKVALDLAGFYCIEAVDARSAYGMITDHNPDLVLLDWMLPGENGIDIVRRLKKDELTATLPIIMLTAKADEDYKIKGFEVGADDYMTKPFSPRELIARIKAVLRRSMPAELDESIVVEGLVLDPASHRVSVNEVAIDMGPTEYRLLLFFMTHQERVYSRAQLLDQVWGGNVYVEERTVDVHIRRLRKVLTEYDRFVQTVRGAGYRFSARKSTEV